MGVVRNDVKGLKTLPLKDLKPFQGKLKDLSKENYSKLRKQIERLGFSEPISIWEHEGNNYILNGHQRIRTLQIMAEDGVQIPAIPVVSIAAGNPGEAKRKVLALTSQYGEITGDGLLEFMTESGIEWPEVKENFRFPEIDFEQFENEYADKEPEITEGVKLYAKVPETTWTQAKSEIESLFDKYKIELKVS